jgi:quaternary ammonium compound-resistance protein SugE
MMAWVWLTLAGLLELVWAIGIKYTEGFTRLLPSAITIAAMIGSVYLLGILSILLIVAGIAGLKVVTQ